MASISSGILGDSNLMNLKEMPVSSVRSEVTGLLVSGEESSQAFQTVRDQVVFTKKRVVVINVQGITGKKISHFSCLFSKAQYYGVETAGVMDIDSELVLIFSDGNRLQFDFKSKVDTKGDLFPDFQLRALGSFCERALSWAVTRGGGVGGGDRGVRHGVSRLRSPPTVRLCPRVPSRRVG